MSNLSRLVKSVTDIQATLNLKLLLFRYSLKPITYATGFVDLHVLAQALIAEELNITV